MSIPSNIPPKEPRTEKVEKTNGEAPRNPSDHKVEEIGKQLQNQPESINAGVDFDATLNLENFPPEILVRIFDKLPKNMRALHRQLPFVSKSINENFQAFVNHQLNQGEICLTDVGCDTAKKAVQYIIDQNLIHASLCYISTDGEDLKKLSTSGLNLITLTLSDGTFTEDELVKALEKFPTLQSVCLISMPFPLSEKFTEVLGTLTDLRSLSLSYCLPFTSPDAFAKALGHLTNLESLDIGHQTVNMDAVSKLINLKGLILEECSVEGNLFTGDKNVLAVLKKLYLVQCKISGDQLTALAKSNPKLEELRIRTCPQLPGDHIVEAIKWLPDLKSLKISGCILSNDQLVSIVKGCPNLVCFDLGFYHKDGISKEMVKDLASQFPNVKFKLW